MAKVAAFAIAGVPRRGLPNTITVRGNSFNPFFAAAAPEVGREVDMAISQAIGVDMPGDFPTTAHNAVNVISRANP